MSRVVVQHIAASRRRIAVRELLESPQMLTVSVVV
jgi:hypothetical protein